jgi:ABC-type Fe3+/spermidine/putrescine transport system ATPase subunit
MSEVSLHQVRKVYGDAVAVDDVSLRIAQGEFVTLLGASGSGKTTCLRMVAGFVLPSAGRVEIGGRDVTTLPPYKRDTAMVFQHYALFPHLSVQDNIAFGLSVRKVPRDELVRRVREALDLVRLGAFGGRYPSELSGGQRQRVALARAVVVRPQILLLDEPLGALDLKLREELQVEIKRVQSALRITTLFVTHDQGEALSMSDRVAVMRDGRIIQVDTPTTLYAAPASQYVARFIGRITLIPARVEALDGERIALTDQAGRRFASTARAAEVRVGDDVAVAVRPEHYRIGADLANRVDAVIENAHYQGASWTLACRDEAGIAHIVDLPWGAPHPRAGETVRLGWDVAGCRVFPAE